MRSIDHAPCGWPTPLGAASNAAGGTFDNGTCTDEAAAKQLRLVGHQAATFAGVRLTDPSATETV